MTACIANWFIDDGINAFRRQFTKLAIKMNLLFTDQLFGIFTYLTINGDQPTLDHLFDIGT